MISYGENFGFLMDIGYVSQVATNDSDSEIIILYESKDAGQFRIERLLNLNGHLGDSPI